MSDATEETDGKEYDAEEMRREAACRAGYVKWRMNDLPALYSDLLPYSVMASELYDAERAIRRQYREDQKLASSPWLRVGPRCCLLDFTGMSASDHIAFGMECEKAIAMPDAYKLEMSDHPEVVAALEAAQHHPIYKLHAERGDLVDKLGCRSAYPFKPGERDQLMSRLTEVEAAILSHDPVRQAFVRKRDAGDADES